jgi:hypothetical protein
MHAIRRLVVAGTGAAALAASLVAPAPSAVAAPPPTPSVLTVDDSSAIWLSSAGNAPTQLRAGSPDVFPGIASDDGSTAAWFLGAAMPQMVVTYNGTITRTVSDKEDTHALKYDVAAAAAVATVAVPSPTAAGWWDISTIDATTGADISTHSYHSAILDIWLSADGSKLYLLLGTDPWTVYTCSATALATCSLVDYINLSGASNVGAYPVWDTVSADGKYLAGLINTGPAQQPAKYQAWQVVVGASGFSLGGATDTPSMGRFVGNELYVAEPGHLYDFAGGTLDMAHPTNDTPMAMNGDPDFFVPAGSSYNGTFTAPTAITTKTYLLRLLNGSFISLGSQTLAITTTLNLYPGTTAQDNSWPYLYWDQSVSHVQYSYDKVTWTDYPWFSSALGVRQNIWLKAVHDGEINATASSSAPILISAKPVVTAGYKPATRTMYGAATVPDGTKVYVQRRISTNVWSTYATPLAKSKAYSVKLPAVHGQWRAVVLATSTYVQSISTTVVT